MPENLTINIMKNLTKLLAIIFVLTLLFCGCYNDSEEDLYKFSKSGCDTTNVTYAQTVEPIIQTTCSSCHGGTSPSGNLTLQSYSNVVSAVSTKNLYARISSTSNPMPPSGLMNACTIKQIKRWINMGSLNN